MQIKKQTNEYLQKVKVDKQRAAEAFKSSKSESLRIIDAEKKKIAELIKTEKSQTARIKNAKEVIKRNTKKIDQIEKKVTKCLKTKNKNARCPNGTHKNRKSGTCEKK